jgi:small subunit ribosomal protein S17
VAQGTKRRRVGRVLSNKTDKTIVVQVETFRRHRIYGKATRIRRKLMAHDPENACQIGDLVEVESSRPLSRRKRWRLIEVVERAELTAEERAAAFAEIEEAVAAAAPAPEADEGATAATGQAEGQAEADESSADDGEDEPSVADGETAAEVTDEPEDREPADATDAAAEADEPVAAATDEEQEDDKA